jgi:hypothetical protein
MIWSFFPPSVDINAISEALSSLRLYIDEGQALEGDWPGSSCDRSTWAGKPHGHEKAHGQSSTTFHLNLDAGEIPVDLSTHHMQSIVEVLVTTEIASSTSCDDFSGLDNPGTLHRFVRFCDYLLDGGVCNNDGYELTWP